MGAAKFGIIYFTPENDKMSIPTPKEILTRVGFGSPEQLAVRLGVHIVRRDTAPHLPQVTILSEYGDATIVLYTVPLAEEAARRHLTVANVEQWLIAHELYHHVAEQAGVSAWLVRETAADHWADTLLALLAAGNTRPPDGASGGQ